MERTRPSLPPPPFQEVTQVHRQDTRTYFPLIHQQQYHRHHLLFNPKSNRIHCQSVYFSPNPRGDKIMLVYARCARCICVRGGNCIALNKARDIIDTGYNVDSSTYLGMWTWFGIGNGNDCNIANIKEIFPKPENDATHSSAFGRRRRCTSIMSEHV